MRLSATTDKGGSTTIDGVESDDEQDNSRAGVATLAVSLHKNLFGEILTPVRRCIRVLATIGPIGVAWQYRWGGGVVVVMAAQAALLNRCKWNSLANKGIYTSTTEAD